jgi:hypothetical protein
MQETERLVCHQGYEGQITTRDKEISPSSSLRYKKTNLLKSSGDLPLEILLFIRFPLIIGPLMNTFNI